MTVAQCMMHSRVQFGMMNMAGRSNDVLLAQSSFRSTSKTQSTNYLVGPEARSDSAESFSDETEAIQEIKELDQGGEGIFDVAKAAFQLGKKIIPGAFGVIEKAVPIVSTALKVGKAVGSLAVGPVGTTISNVLSEKFNKNPEWRPGFPGEAHLVLPTAHGITRANFCGPGTNLQKRLKRGDRGVSQIDSACEVHDSLYSLAKSEKDIRAADERLIRDINKATDAGSTQKAVLKAGIRAKTLGEDVGLFGPETFTKIPGLSGSGGIRGSGSFGNLQQQNKFLNNTQRDVRSILTRGIAKSRLPAIKRFGGNGVIHPGIISDDNLMKLARRLQSGFNKSAVPLGNVRKTDPTISGRTHGAGYRGAGMFENRKPGYGTRNPCTMITSGNRKFMRGDGIGSAIGVQHPNRQELPIPISPFNPDLLPQPSLNPMSAIDDTRRKAIDPTIRGMSTSSADDFSGEGIKEILETPAKLLHKAVRKTLKKQRKKKKPAVKLAGKVIRQLGLGHQPGGQSLHGGQFGILAGLAASIIVPEIIKAIKGNGIAKSMGLQAGSGPGKKLALDVARRHGLTAKNLGMTAKQVKALLDKTIAQSNRFASSSKQGKGCLPGGQFDKVAGLAASALTPELIKLISK